MTTTKEKEFDLLHSSKHSGWGAKLGAVALNDLLKNFTVLSDPSLIVGFDTSDDAAIYKINEEIALIFTMDFFPAITGNAYMFGQIAASNALSDVYAMGGDPKLALNLFCFPTCMPTSMASEVLRGGFDKVREAGCILCGGHTINDDIPKYGLAVNGFVNPNKILRNSTAKAGDLLILTKPIGSGILTTATKGGLITEKEIENVYKTMAFLNKVAKDEMVKHEVHACTDITGFGLLGHCYEMAKSANVNIKISASSVPIFPSVLDYAREGILAAGVYENIKFVGNAVQFNNVAQEMQDVLFDPQTSGGLLISIAEERANDLYKDLENALSNTVCGKPRIIGRVLERKKNDEPFLIVENSIDF